MRRILLFSAVSAAVVLSSVPAAAQTWYRPYRVADPATGEQYHVELSGGWWNPTPALLISSESLGIVGTTVDVVGDLGVAKSSFTEFKLVLRPATKHKFLFGYLPVDYEADTILKKDIIFNGIRFSVGVPVQASLSWKMISAAYEYDFLYRDRWFVGFILGADYTDVEATLDSPIDHEYARARAPIPFLGGTARVYVVPNISVTAKITGFKLPESIDEERRYAFRLLDVDVYGTLNFTDHFGVQGGYRSYDVTYRMKSDWGDFQMNGWYLRGVVRF